MNASGQNYRLIPKTIKELNLDTSHFLGQGHMKNKTHYWAPKKELEEILIENSTYISSHTLKQRLVKEKLLTYKCSGCSIVDWKSEIVNNEIVELSLHLDHVNGKKDDNRIENLRLLCPNCHSLTETYAGKNINGGVRKERTKSKKIYKKDLCSCGNSKSVESLNCRECSPPPIRGQINWPKINEVLKYVEEGGILGAAKIIGCSEESVRLHIKHYESGDLFCVCGKEKFPKAKICRSCQGFKGATKIVWPSDQELIDLVKNSSFLAAGKILKVSDNAIRKRLYYRGYNLTELFKKEHM